MSPLNSLTYGRYLTLPGCNASLLSPMKVSGALQAMDMADLLGWAARRAPTGVLQVGARSTRKRLVLRKGLLDATSSNDPRDMLGQFLVRDGLITEQQLFETLLRQESDRRLLGALLTADGLVAPGRLAQALRQCAEETVYDVFLWTEGNFEFRSGDPGPIVPPLHLELPPLIDEGVWRQTEWQKMRQTLPSLEVTFRVLPVADASADAGARRLLDLARAGHSLARMSLEIRRSPFDTAAHLLALCEQGFLEVDRVGAPEPASDPVAAIEHFLKEAARQQDERRFDAAMSSYEGALALDPLNQEAKKGLLAVADGRRRLRRGSRVPLDRVPVMLLGAMALTQQVLDPQEGFLLSRINGEWNVQSILKLCPIPEDQALEIFANLIERHVIELV
jgi:hypothetical protein